MTVRNKTSQRPAIRHLLGSVALVAGLATSALADGHTAAFSDFQFDTAVNLNTSELIGARVYASESDIANEPAAPGAETEWDDIGEINEIVLTRDGEVASVIVGVGGFLGMGEKDVAITMDQLQIVSDGEDADDYFLVVKASAAGVEDAPSYAPMMDDMQSAADEVGRLVAPDVTRDGYTQTMTEQLTAEMLTGARVYGIGDEDVGEISSLLLTDEGQVERAIIDVGGFIGIGEKPVAVTMEELTVMQSDDEVRVYIDATQEALEALPEYDG